ncbi:hypothetical protein [Ekhidna sp.]|uniref:hypothetical protein n=1 Tax=Ekhidna sp. TaxID=2608089 RepID=UPI00329A6E11
MDNILNEIESQTEIDKISFKEIRIWSFLRNDIFFNHALKKEGFKSKQSKKILFLLKTSLLGLLNLLKLRNYNYFIFTNAQKRFQINGSLQEIFFEPVADYLGQNKVLFIEKVLYGMENKVHSKNRMAEIPFFLISTLVGYIISYVNRKKFDECYSSLKNELEPYDLNFEIRGYLCKRLGQYYFFNWLFKHLNLKAVFLICSYGKVPLILAARHNGIRVIEYQHGIIARSNPFYFPHSKFEPEYYPNTLYSFGNDILEFQEDKSFLDFEKVFPLGNYYISHVKHNNDILTRVQSKIGEFEKVLCVSFQGIFEEELAELIRLNSDKNHNWLFILRPRPNSDLILLDKLKSFNVIFWDEISIYEALLIADYNITIYSTTAIDALFLGAQNILLNIRELSTRYLDMSKMNPILLENIELIHLNGHGENLANVDVNYYYTEFNLKRLKSAVDDSIS